jgi:hypothetical protein
MAGQQLRALTNRERTVVTRHRLRHAPVMAPIESVQDSDGALGFPIVTLSTLDRMELNGTITREM